MIALVVGLTGCGSSTAAKPVAVPGGAAVEAAASAPAYCKTLTRSKPLLQLSAAMSMLARDPHDAGAEATVGDAAVAVKTAAAQAPRLQRLALLRVASAIRALGTRGLAAANSMDAVLTHAGRVLQGACSFPLG